MFFAALITFVKFLASALSFSFLGLVPLLIFVCLGFVAWEVLAIVRAGHKKPTRFAPL